MDVVTGSSEIDVVVANFGRLLQQQFSRQHDMNASRRHRTLPPIHERCALSEYSVLTGHPTNGGSTAQDRLSIAAVSQM